MKHDPFLIDWAKSFDHIITVKDSTVDKLSRIANDLLFIQCNPSKSSRQFVYAAADRIVAASYRNNGRPVTEFYCYDDSGTEARWFNQIASIELIHKTLEFRYSEERDQVELVRFEKRGVDNDSWVCYPGVRIVDKKEIYVDRNFSRGIERELVLRAGKLSSPFNLKGIEEEKKHLFVKFPQFKELEKEGGKIEKKDNGSFVVSHPELEEPMEIKL
jgi:hypothetical protein